MKKMICAILFVLFAHSGALAQGSINDNVVVCSEPGCGGSSGVTFTPLHLYYMSPSGSDSNNGTSPRTPWATPNHTVDCGDVIIAAAGTYNAMGTKLGSVNNCPSTSGGIDGTGGIYAAVVLCGGTYVGACLISDSSGRNGFDFSILSSAGYNNWAVEGWAVTTSATRPTSSAYYTGFFLDACNAKGSAVIHHVILINDITYANSVGVSAGNCNASSSTTPGWDYLGMIGIIIQNSNSNNICLGALNLNGPKNFDSHAGTHNYFADLFLWSNDTTSNPCSNGGTDMEGIILDTWDNHPYTQQSVFRNSIIFTSTGYGLNAVYSRNFRETPTIKMYNLTLFANGVKYPTPNANATAEVILQGGPWDVTFTNSITRTNSTTSNGARHYGFITAGSGAFNAVVGGWGTENVIYGLSGRYQASFDGTTITGPNFNVDPGFNNTTDLLANRNGVPNCSGFETVTECMGWNPNNSTLTNPSTIYDLTPTCADCTGKGYQPPTTTCGPLSDYPAYLKGLNYLHWNSLTSTITEKRGLSNKPCGM